MDVSKQGDKAHFDGGEALRFVFGADKLKGRIMGTKYVPEGPWILDQRSNVFLSDGREKQLHFELSANDRKNILCTIERADRFPPKEIKHR